MAKKAADPLNYTSPGPRGVGHLAGEMLKQRAGIQMTHINYNGSAPALTDVIAGRVPLMFDIWHSAKRYVDSGELKLIAGAGAGPASDAPSVPTIAETYPGFDVMAFNALVAPAGRAGAAPEKLSADIRAVVTSEASRTRAAISASIPARQHAERARRLDARRDRAAGRRSPRRPTSRRTTWTTGIKRSTATCIPTVPDMKALLPYLDDYWRDTVEERGIELARDRQLSAQRAAHRAPGLARQERPGRDRRRNSRQVLDRWQAGIARSATASMACSWCTTRTWRGLRARGQRLDRQGMARPRAAAARLDRGADAEHRIRGRRDRALRQGPALRADPGAGHARGAARAAGILADLRGRRAPRPAARHPCRLELPPSGHLARLAELLHRGLRGQAQGFQSQVASLITEGVFAKFPDLKVVLIESGVTWLPASCGGSAKFWRGVRTEVPWVDRSPAEIVRDHFRLTIQPFDAPDDADVGGTRSSSTCVPTICCCTPPTFRTGSSTATSACRPGSRRRCAKILVDNPLATYLLRLAETRA